LPMQSRDPFPTFPTGRSNLRALDRNYDFSPLIYRSLQDPDIGNIERYCDLRFRHVGLPVSTGFLPLILSLHLAPITATPNEPGWRSNSAFHLDIDHLPPGGFLEHHVIHGTVDLYDDGGKLDFWHGFLPGSAVDGWWIALQTPYERSTVAVVGL